MFYMVRVGREPWAVCITSRLFHDMVDQGGATVEKKGGRNKADSVHIKVA